MICVTCGEELPDGGTVLDQHGWRHVDCPEPSNDTDLGHDGCYVCAKAREAGR